MRVIVGELYCCWVILLMSYDIVGDLLYCWWVMIWLMNYCIGL